MYFTALGLKSSTVDCECTVVSPPTFDVRCDLVDVCVCLGDYGDMSLSCQHKVWTGQLTSHMSDNFILPGKATNETIMLQMCNVLLGANSNTNCRIQYCVWKLDIKVANTY